jgi:hypothetical protein
MGFLEVSFGDGESDDSGINIFEMIANRKREMDYAERMFTLVNSVYIQMAIMEPEHRTPDQEAVMRFIENVSHVTSRSLGMCTDDDPMHEQEHFARMRTDAFEANRLWQERKAQVIDDPEATEYCEKVDKYVSDAVKGINP